MCIEMNIDDKNVEDIKTQQRKWYDIYLNDILNFGANIADIELFKQDLPSWYQKDILEYLLKRGFQMFEKLKLLTVIKPDLTLYPCKWLIYLDRSKFLSQITMTFCSYVVCSNI